MKLIQKLFVLIFSLLSFYSCMPFEKARHSLNEQEAKIYNEWIYAYKIDHLKFNGELISRPPGVSQLVFRLIIPAEGGLSLKTHCVYYQVPYKKLSGFMSINELNTDSPCPEVSAGNAWVEIENMSNLLVKLENFKLTLSFNIKDQKKIWEFVLPNIEDGLIHEKYQPMKERKLYSGMSLLRMNDESLENQNNKYLGKLNDRMSRGSSIRCMQVDKNCQIVGEDRCDDCRYGWYQVVDYNCPQGGSKFCGQNHCGEKNEPACPRGSKVVSDKESGICQSDLTAVLNAEHVLICQ